MNKYPMTVSGAKALEEELNELKINRAKISQSIAEAREHGDLKENAEYHAAREQQGLAEARIRDIEAKLSNAQIIDVSQISPTGRVIFGSTVTIENCDNEESITYKIVGEDEADIKQCKISSTSPIARALMGKEEGEVVTVTTPSGIVDYEIISVKHL